VNEIIVQGQPPALHQPKMVFQDGKLFHGDTLTPEILAKAKTWVPEIGWNYTIQNCGVIIDPSHGICCGNFKKAMIYIAGGDCFMPQEDCIRVAKKIMELCGVSDKELFLASHQWGLDFYEASFIATLTDKEQEEVIISEIIPNVQHQISETIREINMQAKENGERRHPVMDPNNQILRATMERLTTFRGGHYSQNAANKMARVMTRAYFKQLTTTAKKPKYLTGDKSD
jgi:hypothetical protein